MSLKDLFVVSDKSKVNNDYVVPQPQISPDMNMGIDTTKYNINHDIGFINDVYDKEGLTDLSRSIFKAEEISATLPDTLPTDTKRTSVIGILSSFSLSVEELVTDGIARTNAIDTAQISCETNFNNQIADANNTIEELKQKISDLQADIVNITESKNAMNAAAAEEIARINNLINFIDPSAMSEEGGN